MMQGDILPCIIHFLAFCLDVLDLSYDFLAFS